MADYQSGYTESHALIIGINSYSDRRFVPLGEAEADAGKLADVLSKPPFNFKVKTLLGGQATRKAILEALHDLRDVGANDRVLVYFAGHGYALADNFGQETGYVAAVDTLPDQDYTAIELEEITDLSRHSQAKHVGFIFDACFSGQALGLTRAPSVAGEKYTTRRAYQVLSAGAGDQTVSDYDSMTDVLIEALGMDLAGTDEVFTFSDLGLYIQQVMAARSRQSQIPQFGHIRGSQGGDLVFEVKEGAQPPRPIHDYPASRAARLPGPPAAWIGGGAGLVVVIVLGILALLRIFPPPAPTPTPPPDIDPVVTAEATEEMGITVVTEEPPTDRPLAPVSPGDARSGVDTREVNQILIPAGSFTIGFDPDLADIICLGAVGNCDSNNYDFSDEAPIHTVNLSRPFWMDLTEVTNAQYRECVNAGVCDEPQEKGSNTRNNYYGNRAFQNYPVVWVTWEQADKFCRDWRGGRLPTEAEWEMAARGSNDWVYPWGNSAVDSNYLNFCDTGCDNDWADNRAEDGYRNDTSPVGSYPDGVSPFGLHDMAGNVWEWVSDWYGPYPNDLTNDPTGPAEGGDKIRRGGSWANSAALVRLSNRGHASPLYADDDQGFRCARTP